MITNKKRCTIYIHTIGKIPSIPLLIPNVYNPFFTDYFVVGVFIPYHADGRILTYIPFNKDSDWATPAMFNISSAWPTTNVHDVRGFNNKILLEMPCAKIMLMNQIYDNNNILYNVHPLIIIIYILSITNWNNWRHARDILLNVFL